MTSKRPIGVAVIGLGVMGRTHLAAYRAADQAGFANRLVAVADASAERLSGRAPGGGNLQGGADEVLFDPESVLATTDVDALLHLDGVELVSICTHTDTHVELALRALQAGKHVLVEKPVAIQSSEALRLARAAKDARTICMPAMCMRFWPGWRELATCVRERRYGATRSAVFRRLGTAPDWAQGFYARSDRSGGALFDLHVHDADFVRACFGPPTAVESTGSLEHLTTFYRYPAGPPHVVAEGGWDHTSGWPFLMGFTVIFEKATLEYDFRREPKLTLAQGGKSEPLAVDGTTGYDGEVRAILDAIAKGSKSGLPTADEAWSLTQMLEAERASLQSGARVAL